MSVGRLDSELVARGLALSRTKAQRLISEGHIRVAGKTVTKPAAIVTAADEIEVSAHDTDVSRGAKKLRAALATWSLPIRGAECVDLGASTGGFSQVLLEHGASSVVALDVGHSQLDPRLSLDPGLKSFEGVNVVSLTEQWWRANSLPQPSVVVADLSFISLRKVIPVIVGMWGVHSHYVVLVKPQFEVGRGALVGGIVKDARRRLGAVTAVAEEFGQWGVPVRGVIHSPISGEKGNLEYLLYASATVGPHQTEWDGSIATPEN